MEPERIDVEGFHAMGREYFYCSKCQRRLTTDDLASGSAIEVRDKVACDACLADVMAPLSLKEQEQLLVKLKTARQQEGRQTAVRFAPQPPRPAGYSSGRLRAVTPPRATSAVPASSGSSVGLIVVLIFLAAGGTLGALLYFGDTAVPGPKPEPRKEAAAPPAPKPAATPAAAAPKTSAEAPKPRPAGKEVVAADLIALDVEIRAALDREEFKAAIDRIEQARPRHATGEWVQGLEMRIRDINAAAWKVFTPLRTQAVHARQKGETAEVKAATDRVAKWGLATFVTELERSLAAETAAANPPPAPPPPPASAALSEEAKAQQAKWHAAMALAGARDFDAAVKALEGGAAEDLDDLKAAAALHREALAAILRWPRGEKLPLEFYDDTGSLEKTAAPFVRADRESVELAPALLIEISEIAPRTFGALLKGRPEGVPRAAAIACLIEGDAPGARTLLTAPQDSIPAKYWLHAARIDEARTRPATEAGKKAVDARKLYFAAEREHREMKTRGASIEKYRALLNDFADTPVVQQKRARIAARRETAREYVFLAPDLGTSGTFAASSQPKVGSCWTSQSDTDAKKGGAKNNWVEFEFYALQDLPYRAWIMAGGCCQETFRCNWQATELTAPHPQTKEKLAVEPGSDLILEVKIAIPFLKAVHESHGGPKEPKRFEWVALSLPKYAAAGLKRVRILTDQKGFSVAWAAVSAQRTDPPRESEMKDLLKRLEEPAPAVAAAAAKEPDREPERDPSLVGHWKLDDAGGAATDASGKDNTGVHAGDPERVAGRSGGALQFDGRDRHVNVPNSASLENVQEGNYTVSCWFKAGGVPAAGASFALVGKAEPFVGLRYTADQKFAMDHWLAAGEAPVSAVSAGAFAPGAWHFVVGVVNRAEGVVAVWVDGKQEGTATAAPGSPARNFTTESWRIGLASPGRWAAVGALDDVRLHSRALPPADLRALHERK